MNSNSPLPSVEQPVRVIIASPTTGKSMLKSCYPDHFVDMDDLKGQSFYELEFELRTWLSRGLEDRAEKLEDRITRLRDLAYSQAIEAVHDGKVLLSSHWSWLLRHNLKRAGVIADKFPLAIRRSEAATLALSRARGDFQGRGFPPDVLHEWLEAYDRLASNVFDRAITISSDWHLSDLIGVNEGEVIVQVPAERFCAI